MRILLGTTAVAVVMATAALAQTAGETPTSREAPAQAQSDVTRGDASVNAMKGWLASGDLSDIHASDIIGATLYAADAGEDAASSREDWEELGEVDDVLLTRGGEVRAVLVDVGGFLGMGGKTVAAPMTMIRFIAEDDDAEDYDLVVMTDRETLQGAPAYERPSIRAEETNMNNAMPNTSASTSPFNREGYKHVEANALTAGDLESATVYGRGDEKIGSISELIIGANGKITDAVVDVGGFLGMGARSVSMPFADFTVLRESSGDDIRVHLETTKAKLEAMPRYEG